MKKTTRMNEDELLRMINLPYIIQDDKEEFLKLIDELKEILTSDTLLQLEKVVGEFLIREKQDGKPIINDLLRELENSSIPLSKQMRLKMLINDIDQNRYRVKSIFNWLDGAEDNEQDILKRLYREELSSEEQFEKLSALDGLADLEAVFRLVPPPVCLKSLPTVPNSDSQLRLVKGVKFLFTSVASSPSVPLKKDEIPSCRSIASLI